jgi:sRNA-binding protein
MAIGKKKTETTEAPDPKSTTSAKDVAKAKAEAKAEEQKRKAAEKEKEKEEAKAAKAEEKKAAAEKREAMKGLSKLLRSFLARIKYMIYMDNPAAGIEGIENLTWTLTFVNSEGTTITVVRGESTTEIAWTMVDSKKKKTTGVCATDVEALEELFATFPA